MKVLHVIPSLSPKHGGPSFAMSLIARSLAQAGVEVDVATTDDDGPGCRMNVPLARRIEIDGYGIFYFRKQTEFYKVSFPLNRWLKAHAADYDVIHIHALFQFASVAAARCARRGGVPYIIRPLGVLNRWGMENRRKLLKSLSFRFVEKPILRHAAAMHYTSRAEQREAEQTGATALGAVIPLGINIAEFQNPPGAEIFLNRFPQTKGRTLVLFLSRLHEKKGLELLFPVLEEIKRKHPSAMLVIAGNGGEKYVADLSHRAAQLGLTNDIVWTGFLAGADKYSAFAAATVFVLPSYSENFGLAVVEALACGVPVIASRGTPWEDLITHRCGWWVDNRPEVLADALRNAMQLSDDERRDMGKRGRELVEKKYSWPSIAAQMKLVYECVTGSAKR